MSDRTIDAAHADHDADPVFLCNDLGTDDAAAVGKGQMVASSGRASMSVKEAVRIAQSNNFMGLICSARLLVCAFRPSFTFSHESGHD